jgi:hypothetical protein
MSLRYVTKKYIPHHKRTDLSALDGTMSSILNTKLRPYTKMLLYNQALSKYTSQLNTPQQTKTEVFEPVVIPDDVKQLLTQLPGVGITDAGELQLNEKVIPHSDAPTLLRELKKATRSAADLTAPVKKTLKQHLDSVSVPDDVIRNLSYRPRKPSRRPLPPSPVLTRSRSLTSRKSDWLTY